ncbi:MAG: 1-acyl-sn-glycerol-3-phosphate acyltransferase [Gammaproteobacteria bacterium HGW-Gammaproteobacteria-4]|jgi:1-acyl-sn-glycerol-3-phosphate acyltransferase|nr:MAG: 1-acyl-sn-glycerol-3-phosphate acyltransferase [Gammaproteobacteria bacterium HGW-Gammaproteobacteria-4]
MHDTDSRRACSSRTHRDHWRPLRIAWRAPQVLLHVVVALPLMALVVNPLGARISVGGLRWDHRAIRWWSARTARLFGIRVRAIGAPLPGGVMFVANHINWLDIVALHSQHMMGFVAKAEIARWPLVGWLATRAETIYHARGSSDSLNGVMHQMASRLSAGRAVAAFPEGRTTSGAALGTFHARIFQPAISAGALVQPVALRYGERGDAQTVIAFTATENFMSNLLRLIGEPARVAEVHFLEPVTPTPDGRRRMAELCRGRIEAALAS